MDKFSNLKIIKAALFIYIFALVVVFIWWKYFSPGDIPLNEVGDFFGGFVGPTLTFLTIFLLVQNSEEESGFRTLDKEIRVFEFYLHNLDSQFNDFTFEDVRFCDEKNENITTIFQGEEAINCFIKRIDYLSDAKIKSFKKINNIISIFFNLCVYVHASENRKELSTFLENKILWFGAFEIEINDALSGQMSDASLVSLHQRCEEQVDLITNLKKIRIGN